MLKRMPRGIVLLGVVSFLTDLSSEMVYPLLPHVIVGLGGSAAILGLIEGAGETVAAFGRLASGRLSDALGRRKPLAVVGYLLSGISKAAYVVATLPIHIGTARVADRAGKGIRGPPRDALIADTVPRAKWGAAFGLHTAMDTAGAVAAPLVSLALIAVLLRAPEDVLLLAVIPAILSVVVLLFVREPAKAVAPLAVKDPRGKFSATFWNFVLAMAAFMVGNFGLVFVLLEATEKAGPTAALVVYAMFNAFEAGFAYPVGKWSDHAGRLLPLMLGFGVAAAANVAAVFTLDGHWALLLLPAALFGLARSGTEGNGRAMTASLVPAATRATALGVYHAALGLAALPGGLLAGMLWDIDPRLTFAVGSLFCAAALAELSWLGIRGRISGQN